MWTQRRISSPPAPGSESHPGDIMRRQSAKNVNSHLFGALVTIKGQIIDIVLWTEMIREDRSFITRGRWADVADKQANQTCIVIVDC